MKTTLAIISSLFVLFTSCSQCIEGIGEAIEERRTVKPFETIRSESTFDLVLRALPEGEQPYVVVNAQENLLPFVETSVSGTQLTITSETCVNASTPITIELFSDVYTGIENTGTGSITGATMVNVEAFEITNTGTGEVVLSLHCTDIRVTNKGTGSIRLKGETDELRIDNRGTGSVAAMELRSNDATVDNRGTGDVDLQAHSSLDVKLSGTGDVSYMGNPQNLTLKNSGTGEILRK